MREKISTRGRSNLLLVIALLVAAAAGMSSNRAIQSSRESLGAPSERVLVQKALAGFTYGIQHRMPGIAREYLGPTDTNSPPVQEEDMEALLCAAFRDIRAVGNDPILVIARPEISFYKGMAFVDCQVIWHFRNESGEIIKGAGKEHFVLAKNGAGYSIIESRLSPVILRHCSSRKALQRALQRTTEQEKLHD